MDNHTLDRIEDEIEKCFSFVEYSELNKKDARDIKEDRNYRSADILIKTYNQLVRIYYREEYIKNYLMQSVEKEYEKYKENNKG